jgi:hypothetical protein
MSRSAIVTLWEAHKEERWPRLASHQEGPLMTLDTVISGCVVYYLESPEGLDAQRRTIVGDCLADLDTFAEELDEESVQYFQRLRRLGSLLLAPTEPA